jgi:hypothetical protein
MERPVPTLVPAKEPESDIDDSGSDHAPAPVVARPQNTHTIEIEKFLRVGQIDARYHEKPYYVVPREPVARKPSLSFAKRCVGSRWRAWAM